MRRSGKKFLLLTLAVVALATQLLMPAAAKHGLDASVACGTGSSVNALQARMLRVAPPELLQALGYAPRIERQCDQCCSAFDGLAAATVESALDIQPQSLWVWQPKASPFSAGPQFYEATGPPVFRV